jgi:hypothetical protein
VCHHLCREVLFDAGLAQQALRCFALALQQSLEEREVREGKRSDDCVELFEEGDLYVDRAPLTCSAVGIPRDPLENAEQGQPDRF